MERSNKSYVKELVFAVVLTVITIKLQRKVMEPDFFQALKMRGALGVQKYAGAQKSAWGKVEGMAKDFYDIQRL